MIKVLLYSSEYAPGMVQLIPVSALERERIVTEVLEAGGPDEETALLSYEDAEAVLTPKQYAELEDRGEVTVLMDPWEVRQYYGYASNPNGAKLKARVYDYETADRFLGSRQERTIAHNTVIARVEPGEIAAILHRTPIVTFHRSPRSVVLNSGGYRTVTTKAQINAFIEPLGFKVDRVAFEWQVRNFDTQERWEYIDGFTIHLDPNYPVFGGKKLNPDSKYSPRAREFLGGRISRHVRKGYPQKVAVGRAMSEARKRGLKVPAKPNPMLYGEGDEGVYIDGALGEEHAIDRMREMLEDIGGHAAVGLLAELDDPEFDPEFSSDWLDDATELLQDDTAPGYVWIWEAGDLVLTTEEEAEG